MFPSCFTDELKLDVTEALPILKEWGLTHVDFRSRVFERDIHELTDEQLGELRGLLDGHGLKVGAIESSLAKVHLPDRDRQAAEGAKLEGIIRAADALDCRLVRAFFYWQPREDQGAGELHRRPELLRQVLAMFRPLADRAGEAGLVLAFENCGVTPDEVLAMLDALGESRWGLAWDVANSWLSADEMKGSPAACIGRLAPFTRLVHVKAVCAVSGLEDAAPYPQVLKALDDQGFQGPVSVETHNPDSSVGDVAQSKATLDAIRRAWPSAAPGMVAAVEPERPEIKRDYEPVRFVVVGLGMGRGRARLVQSTSGAELVGVCDVNEERAREVGEDLGVPYATDVREWLDNEEVEVVYVLTPSGAHAEVGVPALEAGKHVLTTKPMDVTLEACDRMIRLAEQKDLLLGVDFEMRFQTNTLSLRKAVRSGPLGRMLGGYAVLQVLRTNEYFRRDGGWRGTIRWDGGGVLSNQCVHHVDQVVFLLGVPQQVRCDIWTQDHDIEGEDLGCALWRYADGCVVSLQATTCYPQDTWYIRLELHGTQGAVVLAGGGPTDQPQDLYYLDGAWSKEPPERVMGPWLNAADNFADALRTGAPLACSGRDGRRTQAVLAAMYQSARERDGAWVKVEPELPQ